MAQAQDTVEYWRERARKAERALREHGIDLGQEGMGEQGSALSDRSLPSDDYYSLQQRLVGPDKFVRSLLRAQFTPPIFFAGIVI